MNSKSEQIVIPLSKLKLTLLTVGSVAFMALASWMLSISDEQLGQSPWFLRISGVVGLVFSIICGIYSLIKLFDRRPGLIINSVGIEDNSSALSTKLIKWENIERFQVGEVQRNKFLLIYINHAAELVAEQPRWKQKLMKMNIQMFGTPIAISSNSLKCNFKELTQMLTERFELEKSRSHDMSHY